MTFFFVCDIFQLCTFCNFVFKSVFVVLEHAELCFSVIERAMHSIDYVCALNHVSLNRINVKSNLESNLESREFHRWNKH